jgi:hypothetical protein
MQDMFRHWGSSKGDSDNRLLSSEFVKMFKETPGVIGPSLQTIDLELVFAKCKSQGQKHLEYSQFTEVRAGLERDAI